MTLTFDSIEILAIVVASYTPHQEFKFVYSSLRINTIRLFLVKYIYSCQIEIINGLTNKGQFQYLSKFKGPQDRTYSIQHNFYH